MGRQQCGSLNGSGDRRFGRRLTGFGRPCHEPRMDGSGLGHEARLRVGEMLGSSADQVLLGPQRLGELRPRNRAWGSIGWFRVAKSLPPAADGPGFEP
jgi:hypothetical protein